MRKLNKRLAFGIVGAVLGGAALLQAPAPSLAQPAAVRQEGWVHSNGRWNYWHPGDRRWYHTDGSHWYYHDGKAWQLYRFDRGFGRNGFNRGQYAVPAEGYVVPRHGVIVP